MADLDQAATSALDAVQDLLRAADEAQDRLALAREQAVAATARLDGEWVLLLDRARDFLDQVTTEERELAAARVEALAALDRLEAAEHQLVAEAAQEGDQTRQAFEASFERVDPLPAEMTGLAEATEEAERALQERLDALETEIGQSLGETDRQLRETWAGELRDMEAQVERITSSLASSIQAEGLAEVGARSQALFDQLVATEAALRAALDQAADATEAGTDEGLRTCASTFEDTLAELGRAGSDLEDLLGRLRSSLDDQADRFKDDKDRCDGVIRDAQSSLREAREAVRNLEAALSRFSFVHF